VPLVNWLLSKGIYVSLYTNLSTKRGLELKKSLKLRLVITYHHHVDTNKFLVNYHTYKKAGYRMILEEIGHRNLEVTDRVKPYEPVENGTGGMTDRFTMAPDGTIFVEQRKMYEHLFSKYAPKLMLKRNQSYEERLKERSVH
jgi:hypothetical protein